MQDLLLGPRRALQPSWCRGSSCDKGAGSAVMCLLQSYPEPQGDCSRGSELEAARLCNSLGNGVLAFFPLKWGLCVYSEVLTSP